MNVAYLSDENRLRFLLSHMPITLVFYSQSIISNHGFILTKSNDDVTIFMTPKY